MGSWISFVLSGTAKEVAAAAFDAGVRQGKTCIVVKDVPGFYVNRALGEWLPVFSHVCRLISLLMVSHGRSFCGNCRVSAGTVENILGMSAGCI